MTYKFGTVVLAVTAAFYLFTAVAACLAPERFARNLGLGLLDAGGANEIRAQYAGFLFASAVVCVAALAGMLARHSAFILLATIFGGLIVGRVLGLALNAGISGFGPTILALYVIDAFGFVAATVALLASRPNA